MKKNRRINFIKAEQPLEAAEVKALTDFTKEIDPLIAVSYHTSGREIFWHYKNKRRKYGEGLWDCQKNMPK